MKHSTQISRLLTCILAAMGCPAMAQTSFPGPWWNPVASDVNFNTGMGYEALIDTETGSSNTAVGYEAMAGNLTGSGNTATGSEALATNTTGDDNTASGVDALLSNTTGAYNTAFGASALINNVNGSFNVASGKNAMAENTSGSDNTAIGEGALQVSTTGGNNTALGFVALQNNAAGNNNIGVGYQAGLNVSGGSNNIEIGNEGEATDGVAATSGVIRIGTAGSQKEVFIAGIENSKITGSAVYVTAGGRLGVLASSERYKTAIEPMGVNTVKLGQLRPVTFKLKTDAEGTVQYGLIAEEVDKVYPELVVRDQNGRIDGVRYDELAPMLLNEMQKEQATVATLVDQHAADAAKIASLERKVAEVDDVKQQLSAVIQELKTREKLVAQR